MRISDWSSDVCSSDLLEGAGGDFGAGLGHADDDGLAPAAMAAFQRLTHDLGITYALEGIIGAAISQLDNMIDDVFNLVGINEVRHAELARHGFALGEIGRASCRERVCQYV